MVEFPVTATIHDADTIKRIWDVVKGHFTVIFSQRLNESEQEIVARIEANPEQVCQITLMFKEGE